VNVKGFSLAEIYEHVQQELMKKKILWFLLAFLAIILFLALLVVLAFLRSNRTNGRLVSSGVERAYLLYVPESYDPAVPTPLVISIHGYAEWPAHQMQISHWNDLADQYGFIVVYPSGTHFPLRWRISSGLFSDNDPMLDVAFISKLIDKLEEEYRVDSSRIYANGLSNGGGMSFVLSCALSERIAAIGSVSGAYLFPWDECRPSRKVPAIVFHGTADPIVPYAGGPSRSFDINFPPVPKWIDTLAERNGCTGAPEQLTASGEVSGIHFTSCEADVVFYTIAGGGHAWPGGDPLPESIAGYTSQDIDATRTMWEFFQSHPLADGIAP
jgi:polyhydroxybutyrate depolymerase